MDSLISMGMHIRKTLHHIRRGVWCLRRENHEGKVADVVGMLRIIIVTIMLKLVIMVSTN